MCSEYAEQLTAYCFQFALPLIEFAQAYLGVVAPRSRVGGLLELRHGGQVVHHSSGLTLNSGAV